MTDEKQKPIEKKDSKPTAKPAEKKPIQAKPLPVDKEKTKELEEKMKGEKKDDSSQQQESSQQSEEVQSKSELDKKKPKKDEKPKVKKYEAIAYGQSLHASKKQSMYICSFIKNKKIDDAIADLEQVTKMKKAVPFKGEIPHRKGDMMSGRYPVKVAGLFITILKGLKGNAIVNGLELEDTRITTASASWARRPMRSGSRQGKRVNLILKATVPTKEAKK